MMINPYIFRAYDIRGLAGKDLTQETMKLIGQGIGTYFVRKTGKTRPAIVIGRDNRTHGELLKNACVEGIMSTGCSITDTGLSPSPILYFSTIAGDFDGGISITASHNPKEYNGVKIVSREAHSVCGEEIQAIRKVIEAGEFEKGTGSSETKSWLEAYRTMIQNKVSLRKKLTVVVDAANGIAGTIYPQVLRSLGCEVIELFCDQDGNFPNHEPDPIVEENLKWLQEKVRETNADLGIAFDGDGDRVGIIDEHGKFHDANEILVLLARDILSRNTTNVIYTVSCSSIIPEEVEKAGGKAIMVPVGHSYVEEAMRRHNALLGGEQSGHFFIAENYFPFDDACFTAARLLQIISEKGLSASELFATVPKIFATPEIRPDVSDEQKFTLVKSITREFEKEFICNTMDGVRIDMGDGSWVSIRASNTSPKLSVCTEARTPEKLVAIDEMVWNTLGKYGIKKP